MNAPTTGQSKVEKVPGDVPRMDAAQGSELPPQTSGLPPEYGGRKNGLEPTRYGDWEKDGRCIDF